MELIAILLQSTWGVNKLDYLVNNAGIGATVPFEKVTEALFNDFLNVHYKGKGAMEVLTKYMARSWVQKASGRIS